MIARITVERILRDDDDASGQSIRDWKIESDAGFITIRLKHGDGFVMLRTDDVNRFMQDLHQSRMAAIRLKEESDEASKRGG